MASELTARPRDDRNYLFDFSQVSECQASDDILEATISSEPQGLTIADADIIDGKVIRARISGGSEGTEYTLTVVATFAGGSSYEEIIPFHVLIP